MRKIAAYIIYTILIACIACACSSDLDLKQSYEFKVTYLPVPQKLKVGETAEIRCQIERSGYYKNTAYKLRYFQTDGEGTLRLDDGTIFLPNDYYDLDRETFRLFFTAGSEEQNNIDIYFFDSEGNSFTLNLSFNYDSKDENNNE
ncbi:TraQ conjugal transfer family protein [Dysgonomonas termitidis]|uniref:TraQ conjugal transfer family protein n=1 Tax=Dysgonomonas termitidis TaxID=1516126 RepID=A0ABV9KYA2_9BACT